MPNMNSLRNLMASLPIDRQRWRNAPSKRVGDLARPRYIRPPFRDLRRIWPPLRMRPVWEHPEIAFPLSTQGLPSVGPGYPRSSLLNGRKSHLGRCAEQPSEKNFLPSLLNETHEFPSITGEIPIIFHKFSFFNTYGLRKKIFSTKKLKIKIKIANDSSILNEIALVS